VVAIAGLSAGRETVMMIETAIALGVAAVPEGLPIVATIALACQRLWQGLEQAQARRHVAQGLLVGGAVARPLPSLLPIPKGLRSEPGLRVMLGHQLGLGCCHLGKLLR
jgi:hypothetical protein